MFSYTTTRSYTTLSSETDSIAAAVIVLSDRRCASVSLPTGNVKRRLRANSLARRRYSVCISPTVPVRRIAVCTMCLSKILATRPLSASTSTQCPPRQLYECEFTCTYMQPRGARPYLRETTYMNVRLDKVSGVHLQLRASQNWLFFILYKVQFNLIRKTVFIRAIFCIPYYVHVQLCTNLLLACMHDKNTHQLVVYY